MSTGVACTVIILIEQPSIIATLTSYLSCDSLLPGEDKLHLNSNRNISCESEDYKYFRNWVVIPGIVLWGAALPLSLFIVLFQKGKSAYKNKNMCLILGSLFVEFKPQRYYWGLLIMIFKVLIYIADTTLKLTIITKAMTIAQIMGIYYLMLFTMGNPYNDKRLFTCEKLAMVAYFVTLFFGIYYINSGKRFCCRTHILVSVHYLSCQCHYCRLYPISSVEDLLS